MKIAVIGSGISGLTAAYLLAGRHDVTLFEAESRLGGHTHTVHVRHAGRDLALDTGFLVYNERTYPNFTRLLAEWDISTQSSEMSFSVHCERSGLEYCGSSLRGLFVQPSNLIRPSFHRMLADILRFNRRGRGLLHSEDEQITLGELLDRTRYSKEFVEQYLLPMGAAIWSAPPDRMRDFPAVSFVKFFHNHGLLSLRNRPQWRTILGGSSQYIEAILRRRPLTVRRSARILQLRREQDCVRLVSESRGVECFDEVVVATHANQALQLLSDPSPIEREVLGAFEFQPNDVVLHTDVSRLPQRRQAWASWNYRVPIESQANVTVTYLLNRLQRIHSDVQYCVTLNDRNPYLPGSVLRRITFEHPVFNARAIAAQRRFGEINGRNRTYFCGAYWGYGFHEDGVNSAIAVAKCFEKRPVESCKVVYTKV